MILMLSQACSICSIQCLLLTFKSSCSNPLGLRLQMASSATNCLKPKRRYGEGHGEGEGLEEELDAFHVLSSQHLAAAHAEVPRQPSRRCSDAPKAAFSCSQAFRSLLEPATFTPKHLPYSCEWIRKKRVHLHHIISIYISYICVYICYIRFLSYNSSSAT